MLPDLEGVAGVTVEYARDARFGLASRSTA